MTTIIEHKPRSRGVTQLMYVGDDQAVEGATGMNKPLVAAAIGCLAYAFFGTGKGRTPAAITAGLLLAFAKR